MENEYFSKDEIVAADDLKFEDVPVPEWGGKNVRVKMMSALEKDAYEKDQYTVRLVDGKPQVYMHLQNKSAKLAARCMVNTNGTRLFGDDEIDLLAKKSAFALQRVVEVAQRLNAISGKDVKELAEALKNDQPVSGDTD